MEQMRRMVEMVRLIKDRKRIYDHTDGVDKSR